MPPPPPPHPTPHPPKCQQCVYVRSAFIINFHAFPERATSEEPSLATASVRFGLSLWLADKSVAYYPSHPIGAPRTRPLFGHCAGRDRVRVRVQVLRPLYMCNVWCVWLPSEINGWKPIKLIFLLFVIPSICFCSIFCLYLCEFGLGICLSLSMICKNKASLSLRLFADPATWGLYI